MLLAWLVIFAYIALIGLGNNRRLGTWLQPRYDQVMNGLQARQDTRYQRPTISRNAFFVIAIAIVAIMYGFVFWVGSRFGAPAAFIALTVMTPLSMFAFAYLPAPAQQTQSEREADGEAWDAFYEKLFYRVVPLAVVGWLLYKWSEGL